MTPEQLAERGIRIKPMHWMCVSWEGGNGIEGEDDDGWEADTGSLPYRIDWFGGEDFRLEYPDDRKLTTTHQSLADAKAAAEADHAARVCAMLEVIEPANGGAG